MPGATSSILSSGRSKARSPGRSVLVPCFLGFAAFALHLGGAVSPWSPRGGRTDQHGLRLGRGGDRRESPAGDRGLARFSEGL